MMKGVVCCLLVLAVCGAYASFVPSHVYLSLTGIPTQAQVSFTLTTLPTHAQVKYYLNGTTNVTTVSVVDSDVTSFKRPTTSTMNYIISVTLQNLQRGQYYHYQIIGDSTNAKNTTSKTFTFKHIPAADEPVTLGIYGDLGSFGYVLMQTSASGLPAYAAKGAFDVVIHNGDLAYNLGTNDGKVGDDFMKNIEAVAAAVPYIVTPGNHEFMNSGDDEKYYKNFWAGQTMLGKNSKSTSPTMWFSFDIGAVHVVGISTEVYCEDTANVAIQYAWLENDLKAASARSPRPWIVVLGHRPLYQSSTSHLHTRLMREGLQCTDATLKSCSFIKSCTSGKNCAYSIEDLLVKYEVDMYNAGHVHSYIRHNPIFSNLTFLSYPDPKQYVNPKTTVHIISGAAGTENAPSSGLERETAPEVSPAIAESSAHGFSTLVAYNNTHLLYKQISAENGAVVDEFWIIKNDDTPSYKLVPFTINTDSEEACDQ